MNRTTNAAMVIALASISVGAFPQEKPSKTTPSNRPANRLAKETSPYLLMHAHNPVDWYPWGDEALQKAKRDNKPIFLSIGYSSCHWCHVMERESFLDDEIAKFLNEHFICIKVDREERPDIDSIYMTALQVYNQVTGNGRGGGWPLSMFLTPDCKPFFGGTYFPARDGDRGPATGFLTLVKRIQEIWSQQSDRIRADGEELTKIVKSELDRRQVAIEPVSDKLLASVLDGLEEEFDPEHGGFGYIAAQPQKPKFPEPSNLVFLIDRLRDERLATADQLRARTILVGSLDAMARGGIRDHLGGGLHRYSVDRYWQIPHFEKMLYDNGQLASIYAEAFALTGRAEYRRLVEQMLAFVSRELTDAGGAFYSALDADSENEEGKFYRWEKSEVEKLLSPSERELWAKVYGLNEEPNFEERFFVFQFKGPLADTAKELGLSEQQLVERLEPMREKLLTARAKRPRPLTDSKILTSWNGLMIRGYADAGRILKQPEYIDAAERAANFILKNLRTADGRLQRTHSQGQSKLNAYLDDYAFMVDGLLGLYQATGKREWLDAAKQLTDKQIDLFWDETRGGFYFTSDDHESLIARGVDPVDGAEPSGNSVSACNLLLLARETKSAEYRKKAERTIHSVAGLLSASPTAAPRMATAVARMLREK